MYEKQRDSLYNQQFNVDQTKFAMQNAKDTKVMVDAMKDAGKELKVAYKDIKIDEIEDLHDDMSEIMEDAEEIQESMGRAYGVPEELDEADLMDELNSLEDEIATEESDELPSYLVNAASATKKEDAKVESKEAATVETDKYGLPQVPARVLGV